MRIRLRELRQVISEEAVTVTSLPKNVKFFESGDDYVHYIYLVDAGQMPDVEAALLGGISVSDYGGPWGVGSVSAHQGYGPLLYRLAMEWVAENAGGRGLTKNRGGETSDAASRVWQKFDAVRNDPASKISLAGEPADREYVSRSGELKKMRTRWIQLTPAQVNLAWGMLTDLSIGGQPRYDDESEEVT